MLRFVSLELDLVNLVVKCRMLNSGMYARTCRHECKQRLFCWLVVVLVVPAKDRFNHIPQCVFWWQGGESDK